MKIRIMTNGEKYQVQVSRDGDEGSWVDDFLDWEDPMRRHEHPAVFDSYREAHQWVEKTYGTRAPLQPRQWVPA